MLDTAQKQITEPCQITVQIITYLFRHLNKVLQRQSSTPLADVDDIELSREEPADQIPEYVLSLWHGISFHKHFANSALLDGLCIIIIQEYSILHATEDVPEFYIIL